MLWVEFRNKHIYWQYTLLHFKICTLKYKKKIVERSAVAQIQKNVRINGIHAKTVQAL